MRILSFCFIVALISFSSCDKQYSDVLTRDNLVGNWEDEGPPEPAHLLDIFYGSALELRKNGEFKIYYWSNGKPDANRADGTWSFINNDKLVLVFRFSRDTCNISEYDGKTMTLSYEAFGASQQMKRR
ncbi:MAG: hypothetical protein L6Q97_23900 [Thermoanaerobaculia bacterium]|nr:hypothetical protein [Thermoanaerobaculia bacterium]